MRVRRALSREEAMPIAPIATVNVRYMVAVSVQLPAFPTCGLCNLRLLDNETEVMYKGISFRSAPKARPDDRGGLYV
jgi:hypothetical protein